MIVFVFVIVFVRRKMPSMGKTGGGGDGGVGRGGKREGKETTEGRSRRG